MSADDERCARCKGSEIEPFPAGVTHQIGAPSCMACWGTGKKDPTPVAKALMMSGRLYGEIHGTGTTDQTVTRTAEQSHLVALAERDDLAARLAEAERLLADSSLADALSSEAWDQWHEDRDAFLNGRDR